MAPYHPGMEKQYLYDEMVSRRRRIKIIARIKFAVVIFSLIVAIASLINAVYNVIHHQYIFSFYSLLAFIGYSANMCLHWRIKL